MFIKITCALIACALNTAISYGADNTPFDTSTLKLSKRGVIETWVHPELLATPSSINKIQKDERDEIESNHVPETGITISKTAIELAFLRHVNELSQSGKRPVTFQISNIPQWFTAQAATYAFGYKGTHYVSLNYPGPVVTTSCLRFVNEDCFTILERFKGKMDAVYVDFSGFDINPSEYQRFLRLLQGSLIPGGKAFLVAGSFESNSLYEEVQRLMPTTQDPYISFMKFTVSAAKATVGEEIYPFYDETIDMKRLSDTEQPSQELLSKEKLAEEVAVTKILHMLSSKKIETNMASYIFSRINPEWRPMPEEIAVLFAGMKSKPELKIDLVPLIIMAMRCQEPHCKEECDLLESEMGVNNDLITLLHLANFASPTPHSTNTNDARDVMMQYVSALLEQGKITQVEYEQKLADLRGMPEKMDIPVMDPNLAKAKLIPQLWVVVLDKLRQGQITMHHVRLIFSHLNKAAPKTKKPLTVQFVKRACSLMMFSPGIYRRIFKNNEELNLLDTFYVNLNGEREDGKWGLQKMFAAAIIQKKERNSSAVERFYSGRNLAGLFALGTLAVLWNFYDDLPLQ